MASAPRRGSKRLPPDLSDLMNDLISHAASFIKEFDISEHRMTQIVEELQKIADKVKEVQERTDKQRRVGVVAGGTMILLAPFTLGLSLLAGAAAAAGVVVVHANNTKMRAETESVRKAEELGKEFMEIVEPLKKVLEEIKRVCEKLEHQAAEAQADRTLKQMQEFHQIVQRVSELAKKTREVLNVALTVMEVMRNMLMLIVHFFRVTATPEEDTKLRESIIQSADQCRKVVDEFDEMKRKLEVFGEK